LTIQRNSPKDKKTFTFFRSRTLSSSSNESNGGGSGGTSYGSSVGSGGINIAIHNLISGNNIGNNNNGSSTSPRLSPRSLFEKVRKRSQSDVKSQTSTEHVNNINNNYTSLQEKLIQHHQQQMQQHQLLLKKQNSLGPPSVGSSRKHLSHSISEENDDYTDYIDPSKPIYYGSLSKSINKNNPNSIDPIEKVIKNF
jgi:hypothetical protein